MQYPRIPHDKKRHVKMTLLDIEALRFLYINRKVKSLKKLAITFMVSSTTIKYWIDPIFNHTERERTSKRLKEVWQNGTEEYREHIRQKNNESKRYHLMIDPIKVNEYYRANSRKKTIHTKSFNQFMNLVEKNG